MGTLIATHAGNMPTIKNSSADTSYRGITSCFVMMNETAEFNAWDAMSGVGERLRSLGRDWKVKTLESQPPYSEKAKE